MTQGGNFMKKGRCKSNHCSSMSNSAWCDLKSKVDALKLQDLCYITKCESQKQITFTPRQFQLEGAGFKNTMKKYSKEVKKLGARFLNQQLTV